MRFQIVYILLILCSFNFASLINPVKIKVVGREPKKLKVEGTRELFEGEVVKESEKIEKGEDEHENGEDEHENGEIKHENGEIKHEKDKELEEKEEKHENGEIKHENDKEWKEKEEKHEELLTMDIESKEIQAAVNLVEFKLTEINELMKECLENSFKDILAEKNDVLTECTGDNYQILFRNYKEAILRVKEIFFELIRLKSNDLDEEYDDEVSFFLDILDQFINMDYNIRESLEISKESVHYYVSPLFFDSLIEFSGPEIDALETLTGNLKESRQSIREYVDEQMVERDEYMKKFKNQTEEILEGEGKDKNKSKDEWGDEEEDHTLDIPDIPSP